jgi:hypothetical protein
MEAAAAVVAAVEAIVTIARAWARQVHVYHLALYLTKCANDLRAT